MGSKATPPTLGEAHEAAGRIHERRVGTRSEAALPDVRDLLGTVHFVQQYRRVDRDTPHLDHEDALRILAALTSEIDRLQRVEIEAAHAAGLTWQRIGEALGMASRQGAHDRLLRLKAAAAGEPRDEATARVVIRQRTARADAAAELNTLIRRTALALKADPTLPQDCWEDLAGVLWYFDEDGPAVPGPGLIPVTWALLQSLARHDSPTGCGDLLAELSDRLPARGGQHDRR